MFNAGLESMKERGLIDYDNNELFVVDRYSYAQPIAQ